jgi:hypothetical protein
MLAGLARGDGVAAGVGPVLRHLLVNDDRDYFADDILATLRGMIADVARQLAGEDHGDLVAALVDVPGLVAQAHALAAEGQVTRRLRETQGMDPVLSPLLQALVASPRGETAALAMQVLAAQARFVQQQRRMQWPLSEMPAELLHGALQVWGTMEGETARHNDVRADYDEGATRLGLLSRLIGELGAGVVAALEMTHAGVAIFASALSHASGQTRGGAVLSMLSHHVERLVLGLRAGGLGVAGVEAVVLALHPDATPPMGLGRLEAERAARLLSVAAGRLERGHQRPLSGPRAQRCAGPSDRRG